jgi:hypothetical protein
LKHFFAEHGSTTRVTQSLIYRGANLGRWVSMQRSYKKNGKLSKERIDALDSIHFLWDQKESDWEYGFACFREFVETNGDARVGASFKCASCKKNDDSPYPLGTWVHFQRTEQANLSEERKGKLLEAGFLFSIFDQLFNSFVDCLKSIVRAGGDPNVAPNYIDSRGNKIGYQLVKYRQNYKHDLLDKEQIDILESLGVSWDPRADLWNSNFSALLDYIAHHEISKLRQKTNHQNLNIGTWLAQQRVRAKSGSLSKHREKRLVDLGVL